MQTARDTSWSVAATVTPPEPACATTPDTARALTDPARLPGLGPAGAAMLRRLREHPAAPIYRNFSGHRLDAWARLQARWQHAWLRHAPTQPHAGAGPVPWWLWAWVWRHAHGVAAWPRAAQWWRGWRDLPTMDRSDLQTALAQHVPWHRRTDDLLCFTTSGTTGHPIRVPSTPLAAAAYLALHERALALHGVRLRAGAGEVGVVLAGFQQRCFTYVSVNPLRGECGLAKINLHPGEWRDPDDRVRYLDDLAPELITGDPVSLSELAALPLRHRPRALLSTSMSLAAGLRAQWQDRFACPVVDLYSMNEAGPIAAYLDAAQGHVLLQPGLYVEILGADGRPVPEGERGEIVVSGGINACLPLLRYRTGDHARLVMTRFGATLRDLDGRPPVRFAAHDGRWVNNVELTQRLRDFPLQRFALHQAADRSLALRVASRQGDSAALDAALRAAIARLLGPLPLTIETLEADDKVRQYTSALADHAPRSDRPGPEPRR